MGEAAEWHQDATDAEQEALHAELRAWAAKRAAKAAQAPREGGDIPAARMTRRTEALRDHVTRGQRDTGKGDTEQVVQVQMAGAQRAYGYAWKGEEPLELGEWVMLPGNVVSPEGCKGKVTGFGRDGYNGPLKEVMSRIERPDPWVARMEAVRTASEARRVLNKARAEGLEPQRLLALERVGREALAAVKAQAAQERAEGDR
jgi:hypothetical protein